jgi:hypothetical protein
MTAPYTHGRYNPENLNSDWHRHAPEPTGFITEPTYVVDGLTAAQQHMQEEFAKRHREPVLTMFERCLYVAFAIIGIVTCLATLYFYLELYLFIDRLQQALQQFSERLTSGG